MALILSACEPVNLYVAHSTVVGLNAAGSADRGSGHLIIGYDRHFGAIVPKSVPVEEGEEAMSVLSCSDLKVDGIFLAGFTEYLATGRAATGFAKVVASDTDPAQTTAMDQMFDCYVAPIPSDQTTTR
ncbi:MAG: hypothetical protein HC869_20100 [Rhodospirillales bacterium]|nr:hypothetical protein [Rhodospirillales bacterium]